MIRVENLRFEYSSHGPSLAVLYDLSLEVQTGEFVAIQGRSGSGKSTLFYLLGGLLSPQAGKIYVDGKELTSCPADELASLRNKTIGFVFQQFHLLPRATVLENILLPSLYPCEWKSSEAILKSRAIELAERVGLGDKLSSFPNQLSGGEQQRVAIARALLPDPPLILADEPTGNLDSRNAGSILALLRELNDQGKTVVLITHDDEMARRCDRIVRLQDGRIVDGKKDSVPAGKPQFLPSFVAPKRPMSFSSYLRLAKAVLPLALSNLKRNKTSSFLTMIGVTIGIASVFAMVTFGQFTKNQILKSFEELGVNTVIIRGRPNWNLKATDKVDVLFRYFDYEKDLKALHKVIPEVKHVSPMVNMWKPTLNYGGYTIEKEFMVWGISAEFHAMVTRKVIQGRPLNPYDLANRSAVCLIGSGIPEQLFKRSDPIGKLLFVTRDDGSAFPCRVIGVLSPETSAQEWRKPDLEVYIPFTYFQLVASHWDREIDMFSAQVHSGQDPEKVGQAIKMLFSQRYGISGNFFVDKNSLLLSQVKKFLGLFAVLITTIALVTLGVGAMGINNMMLVSVAERIKEIGLRKALGATDRSIRVQFLMESSLLSMIAVLVGVLTGFTAYEATIYLASLFVSKIKFAWILEPSALVLSTISILVVGIASGIVPALRAERLSVIEALRNE